VRLRNFRQALRAVEDDPLVAALLRIVRAVNKLAPQLQQNLGDATAQESDYLQQATKEAIKAYDRDWEWYNTALGTILTVSNNLMDLDDQALEFINRLEDLYGKAIELELKADQQNYPEQHPVFKLVDKIEEILNMRLD
jgi:hypothetical protein